MDTFLPSMALIMTSMGLLPSKGTVPVNIL